MRRYQTWVWVPRFSGDPVLWNIVQPVGPYAGQPQVLGRHVEDLLASRHQAGVAETATVL